MLTLTIQHLSSDNHQHRFRVIRQKDSKQGDETQITAPSEIQVEGRPNSDLSKDLRWYLERFLDYPFKPNTDVAERIQKTLADWGKQAFTALFDGGKAQDFYHDAYKAGLENITLKIASDDPQILAWPWEALHDPATTTLAHTCRIERQLNQPRDPLDLPENLPRDRINILMITARPYQQDVGFRSLSRPLLELLEKERLPARIDMLRPPTFERLREVLQENKGYYHIVHFDGHGGYGPPSGPSTVTFKGYQGRLIFETNDGEPAEIEAGDISTLLQEYRIPIMVLNACQSAMLDENAEDAFASVAASLQRAGIRSVVAMAYSLYVTGAQVFLPDFYRRLFQFGDVLEAVRAGRQAMLQNKGRICYRGEHPLDDWLVPVVYQQDPPELNFAGEAQQIQADEERQPLPEEISEDDNPYGFIGRDSALLALERAMRRTPPGILIHGMGGIGKTTLAKGFVRWLADTGGLGNGCFWFTFNDIRSSEHVFNQLVGALFGTQAMAADLGQKIAALVQAFKEHPFVLVWDNFESVSGIEGTEVHALMAEPDRLQLRDFLYQLRGGKTKILITSRSQESNWLNRPNCYRLPLGGLQGEERWEFCDSIVRDLGLSIQRDDAEFGELMKLLDGHPLMMRVMLVQLADYSAKTLSEKLRGKLEQSDDDDVQVKLFVTLGFVEASLPDELKPLLIPLALHERFVDARLMEMMVNSTKFSQTRQQIDQCLRILETAGLLHGNGQGLYTMHPALSGFLRSQSSLSDPGHETWRRAFVNVMSRVAIAYADKPLHEQSLPFTLQGANFHVALAESKKLDMNERFSSLAQLIGRYAQNRRDFSTAQRYLKYWAEYEKVRGHADEAGAYHQLGMIAEEQRDFSQAEQWYRKSLVISEKQSNEYGAALTYGQLGNMALKQRDFTQAEQWYRKSLAIKENLGNEHSVASTYHQLGYLAQEQRDFSQAEQWYQKSLAIEEKQGKEHGLASTYHQLGTIAQEQRDFAQAKRWYRKSLAIEEKQGNEHSAASTYHQLGIIAQEQRDFTQAEQWYQKSLAIKEKYGNENDAAGTYHQLGKIAQEQHDFTQAKQWCRKSLAIFETQGNDYGVAHSYIGLGVISFQQNDFETACNWYIRGLKVYQELNERHCEKMTIHNFMVCYKQVSSEMKVKLQNLWNQANLGPFPEPDSQENPE